MFYLKMMDNKDYLLCRSFNYVSALSFQLLYYLDISAPSYILGTSRFVDFISFHTKDNVAYENLLQ